MAATTPLRAALPDFRTLAARIDTNGPRYTSYPTADRFHPAFGPAQYRDALRDCATSGSGAPLSLYLHVPFCENICYYCGCNKIVTRDHRRSGRYVRYLAREIGMVAGMLGERRPVMQSHWGGGTPTFLDSAEMRQVFDALDEHFLLLPEGEHSIELDPRRVDAARVAELAALGFNRVSLGVQDFDPIVQAAIHRVQSYEETRTVVDAARRNGFQSVSMDLIYGLPHQRTDRFAATLDAVLTMRPERLSVYSYAHLPHLFKPQRRIDEAALPDPGEKLDILVSTIERLTDEGYVYIGMDHFALPDDPLARAQREGRLQRNFQGYATHAGYDQLGFGVSAIGAVAGRYVQNARDLDSYYAAIDAAELPVIRGIACSGDDSLRREIIGALMCNGTLDVAQLEQRLGQPFATAFAAEQPELDRLLAQGLIERQQGRIDVTPLGRLLVRRVAMVFDAHLRKGAGLANDVANDAANDGRIKGTDRPASMVAIPAAIPRYSRVV